MSNKKVIATHSGKFHTDDLFAVSTLQILLGEENTEVVRTRDPEIIEKAEYVVDVGGAHEPEKEIFDHHQKEGAGTHEDGIPYAAFGLVWKKYGVELAGGKREAVYIEKRLVEPIDAGDNGFGLYTLDHLQVAPYTIQSLLSAFRPDADEKKTHDEVFLELLPMVRKILKREIEVAKIFVQAEDEIKQTYEMSEDKKIIIFPKEMKYGREFVGGVLCQYPEPTYAVLYRSDSDVWQTLAIKKDTGTFENRKRLPEEWGGNKTKEELKDLTDIDGIVFVHRAGFMAVSETKEAAVALAQKALSL